MDCLFCKIANGEIPSKKVYEDEVVYVFHDIAPQTPVHVLVIPKKHVASSADEINKENSATIAKIFEAIPKVAKIVGLQSGYRIINNCGEDACQTVPHIHFHLMGGKKLPERMS